MQKRTASVNNGRNNSINYSFSALQHSKIQLSHILEITSILRSSLSFSSVLDITTKWWGMGGWWWKKRYKKIVHAIPYRYIANVAVELEFCFVECRQTNSSKAENNRTVTYSMKTILITWQLPHQLLQSEAKDNDVYEWTDCRSLVSLPSFLTTKKQAGNLASFSTKQTAFLEIVIHESQGWLKLDSGELYEWLSLSRR